MCPKCGEDEVSVIDSRAAILFEKSSIRRRRKCNKCGHRWSTYELPEELIDYVKINIALINKIKKTLGD
jgi:transcriptional regulator NrdR family protein